MAERLDNEVLFQELAREVIDGEMLLCEGQLAFAFLDELTEDVDGQALAFEEVVRRGRRRPAASWRISITGGWWTA